jgi:hypothetical protein
LADPLDRVVAVAVRKDRLHQSPGAKMLEAAMCHEASAPSPLVERVASLIYSYDQDFIDRPWARVGSLGRQTYYDIARAVINEVAR